MFVGVKKFSTYCECLLSIKEIQKLCKNKHKTKIYININRYFFEHEINDLQKLLKSIINLDIDGIIFADFAIPQILFELKIKTYLIYNPETLITNYGQFYFYFKNNINEVCLARELQKNEIQEISNNRNKMKIQMQVCGYSFIMQSRWKLLSNFAKESKLKDNLSNRKLYIREENRVHPMIIYEDDNGTSIHSNYDLDLIQHIKEIKQMNVDTIRIDSFLHDEQWVLKKTKIYLDAIKNDNQTKSDSIFANGFYLSGKDNIYSKENNNE